MEKKVYFLFLRYAILVIFGLGNLFIFYSLFSFPTIFLSYKVLSFFGKAEYFDNIIIFKENVFEIVEACVAGSAYYLLLILSMSIPLRIKKRLFLILFLFSSFFLINVARIILMVFFINMSFFDSIHFLIWNVFSTAFVVLLWFTSTKIFGIKEIPFYTDFLYLKKTLIKKKFRRKKKG